VTACDLEKSLSNHVTAALIVSCINTILVYVCYITQECELDRFKMHNDAG